MKIRTKIEISIVAVGICILISYVGFLKLQSHRNDLLMQSYRNQLEASVHTALLVNNKNLSNLIDDYTTWDEMVTFTKTSDTGWSRSNLSTVLGIHSINALWIFNNSLDIIYSNKTKGIHDFFSLLGEDFIAYAKTKGSGCFYSRHEGFIYEFASGTIHPTGDTLKTCAPSGFMVICRVMDKSALKKLEELSGTEVTILSGDSTLDSLSDLRQVITTIPLHGWDGKLTGTLKFNRKQPLLQAYLTITRLTSLFYISVALLVLVFFSSVLYRWISSPLKKITSSLALEDAQIIGKLASRNNEFGLVARMIERFLAQKRELAGMIHEKNEILANLAASESNNQAILKAIPDHLLRINLSGIITHIHIKGPQKLFHETDDLIGKKYEDVLPYYFQLPLQKAIAEALKTRQLNTFAFSSVDDPLHIIFYEATVSLTHDGDTLIIVHDITQRKEAESTMHRLLEKEGELNRLKTQFITTVSHEFRTPLSAILSNVQLLGMYEEKWSDEKKNAILHRIMQAVGQMTTLLDEVSIIGRQESGKSTLNSTFFNLQDFLEELILSVKALFIPSAGIKATFTLNSPHVFMDKDLLTHIFTNLFTNALKFTPSDRLIFLTVSTFREDQIHFTIQDQGIGIPSHELNKVFEPFHRSENTKNYPGTGLGLPIVRRCVETHMGSITIESNEGEGTTVNIILPTFMNKPLQL